jgi:hypothetical protein
VERIQAALCHAYAGGAQIYLEVDWQNCIAPFNIGCFSDFITYGWNANGKLDYDHLDWADAYP